MLKEISDRARVSKYDFFFFCYYLFFNVAFDQKKIYQATKYFFLSNDETV